MAIIYWNIGQTNRRKKKTICSEEKHRKKQTFIMRQFIFIAQIYFLIFKLAVKKKCFKNM